MAYFFHEGFITWNFREIWRGMGVFRFLSRCVGWSRPGSPKVASKFLEKLLTWFLRERTVKMLTYGGFFQGGHLRLERVRLSRPAIDTLHIADVHMEDEFFQFQCFGDFKKEGTDS